MEDLIKLRVEELWVIDPAALEIHHALATEARDGFYVNEDGDLLLRSVTSRLRNFYQKDLWFRREEYAKKQLKVLEEKNEQLFPYYGSTRRRFHPKRY